MDKRTTRLAIRNAQLGSCGDLIEALRRYAHGRMPRTSIDKLVEEVTSHLDAATRALVEVGVSAEAAEAQAVSEFGDPIDFVKRMARQYPNSRSALFDRPSAMAMIAATCLYTSYETIDRHWTPVVYPLAALFIVGVLGLAVWISVTSWRARYLPVLSLTAAVTATIPLIAASAALSWLPGQPDHVDAENRLTTSTVEFYSCLAAKNRFNADADRFFFKANGDPKTKITWIRSRDEKPDTYRLAPAKTPEEATASWKKALVRFSPSYDAYMRSNMDLRSRISEDIRRSYLQNVLVQIPEAAASSAGLALCLFYVSAFSWLFRYFTDSLSRYFRPKGLA